MEIVISIHAPTRGATTFANWTHIRILDFNPRSYKRSDGTVGGVTMTIDISIHAPTRGATAKMHNYPYTYL